MSKFIKDTLLFLLPGIILLIVIEILLRQIPNDYLLKKKYLDKHSKEIQTLILGSSHSFYGIDPRYFSTNTFNASNVSQTLDYDFEILRKYQDRFIKLETIVLPISYFTLISKLEKGTESWRIKNYVIYYDIKGTGSLSDHLEILSNRFSVNLIRLASYYLKGNANISCTDLGWGTGYEWEKSRDLKETGKKAAARHSHWSIEILEENIGTLKSIIRVCQSKKINVMLVTPPAFETYRQNIDTIQFKKTIETANELATEFSNCRYINLFESVEFETNDFFDADHLNEIGAKKLSLMINDQIIDWE